MRTFRKYLASWVIVLIASICYAGEETFRFAVLCDSRGSEKASRCTDDNYGVSEALRPLVENILFRNASEPVSLMIFPGDMVSGGWKRDAASVAECNRVQLQHWRKIVSPLADAGIKIQVTAGNHEVVSRDPTSVLKRCSLHSRQYTPEIANFKVFQEVFGDMLTGKLGHASDLGLTYSFDMGGCHFAILTSYTMTQNNSFSHETLQWLDHDLQEAKARGLILFVASHPPAFPGGGHMWDSLSFYDPEYACDGLKGIDRRPERDKFWDILKKHGTVAYFCGHEHQIMIQEVEGVWHVVTGGITRHLYPLNGAPTDKARNTILYDGHFQNPRASLLWPWNNDKKSYWGWCLVTVNAQRRVTLEVVGSDTFPTSRDDFKPLISFLLSEGRVTSGQEKAQ